MNSGIKIYFHFMRREIGNVFTLASESILTQYCTFIFESWKSSGACILLIA
jgi:hypothetical protein